MQKNEKVTIMKKALMRIIAIALILVSVLTVSAPAFAVTNIPVGSEATVSNKQGEARVRKSADQKSDKVITLPQGATVKILAKVTGAEKKIWYKVSGKQSGKSFTGYIRHDYLKKKSGSSSTAPAYTNSYGPKDKVYEYGSSNKYLTNIANDLISWAKKTKDPNNKYKYIYEVDSRFSKLANSNGPDGMIKFDNIWAEVVKKFQRVTKIDVDGRIGPQTKQTLWNNR